MAPLANAPRGCIWPCTTIWRSGGAGGYAVAGGGSRRASLGRRRTGVVAALILSALRELHGECREGLQIDLAGLGDTAILRVAETVRALAVRHALAIVVTHDAGAAYVRRADSPDVR